MTENRDSVSFCENELVERTVEENETSTYRILWIHPNADALVVLDMGRRKAMPEWVVRSEWEALFSEGKLRCLDDDEFIKIPIQGSVSDATLARQEKAYAAIKNFFSDVPRIFNPRHRGPLVRAAAAACKVCPDTINNWLCSYFRGGMTKNALLSDWCKCGAPGQDRPDTAVKRGRPCKYSDSKGTNANEAFRRIFAVYYKKYVKTKKLSQKATYRLMLRKCFADWTEKDVKGNLIIKDPEKVPTLREFTYWVSKNRDFKKEIVGRRGRKAYERMFRALLGNCTSESYAPGYRYQIDATIADVYLVSRANPHDIIGRPVLYIVIDVWSRRIVGMYVGLENASWQGAMMALLNAATDKREFCKQYGVELEDGQWDVEGISSVVLGDRGELLSEDAQRMATVLDVSVENTPSYRPDLKGLVEVSFKLIHADFSQFVDGYIEIDYQERGGNDYRLDAKLTLDEFTEIMIYTVLDWNSHELRDYPLTADMIAQGVRAIPDDLWQWGIVNRSGKLRKFPKSLLQFALMKTDTATISEHGVEWRGRIYQCEYAIRQGWHVRTPDGLISKKLVHSYDPRCLDKILIHDPTERRAFREATLVSSDSKQFGLSLQEVESLRRKRRKTSARGKFSSLVNKINFEQKREDVLNRARARSEALGRDDRSKAERTGNIFRYKAVERDERDKERAFTSAEPPRTSSDNSGESGSGVRRKRFSFPSILTLRGRK